MGNKTRKRGRDVPHRVRGLASDDPRRDREFRAGRGRKRGELIARSNDRWPASDAPPTRPIIAELGEIIDDSPSVFGMYPVGFITKLLPWVRCDRRRVLHVCSGALPKGEGIRVDIRPEARPDIIADGRALPFADGSIAAVMLDPPYTKEYARDLYGVEYPAPLHLLTEAARVVRPGGVVVFVHYITPNPPAGCSILKRLSLFTGCGFPLRAVTIYEREQASLPGVT